MSSLERRFHKWSIPEPNSGCWLWFGPMRAGYGCLVTKEKETSIRAHRLAWQLYHGVIPKGMCVCHKCDNPPCVNPDHLFLGTHKDNSQDMARKGRSTHGEKQHASKLSQEAVSEIMLSKQSGRSLARRYGVHPNSISQVRLGKTWVRAAAGKVRSDNPIEQLSHKGSDHPIAKLTESDIPTIRARLARGEFCKDVAADYGVAKSLISAIGRREIWRHVAE